MTLSRWVPDYFETRAGFRPLETDPNTIASTDEWAIAAWGSDDRDDRAGSVTPKGSVDSFSFIHVMVFHPPIEDGRNAAAEGARRLGTLRAGLRLGYRRRRHASVTYVPQDRARPWHFGSDSDPYRALTPMPSDDGAALAAALQSSWLERLTKDIWHG
jgi:hypothetical protein